MDKDRRMPVIFAGHGSPMNAIGTGSARKSWQELGRTLGRPEVIIAVSAHWATDGLFVRRSGTNPQINDMYGFPEELYEVEYRPAGSVEYADLTLEALAGRAAVSNDWGVDHGVWSVLVNMYPEADVPVVMVSTDMSADAEAQFETGRKLSALRSRGAMIFASGNVVHNLSMVNWNMDSGYAWADRFDAEIHSAVAAGDNRIPVEFESLADHEKAVPTKEHYYPLLTALGAAADDEAAVWNDYRELGSMSMTSYLWK